MENDENQDGCEDVDSDGDGFVDQLDKCPSISDDQADLDGDGIGDACEDDTDGDGIFDNLDNCPYDVFDWISEHEIDHDQDGCRDADRDLDDDGDNVLDLSDQCPRGEINWNQSYDHDIDGCHDDFEDDDDDSDGFLDSEDTCPRGYVGLSGNGMDNDEDGCIDTTEDDDDDNDGVLDSVDECKYTPKGLDVNSRGCSGVELDDDGDGVHNLNDLCPATEEGDVVSSTGCTVKTNDGGKSNSGEEETSSLIWILFGIAGILVGIAAYITFKPDQVTPKQVPDVDEEEKSSIDDGGAKGIAALLLPTSTTPDSMSILESPRSLQMNPDAAERTAPSSRLPQIIAFSSSDHLKICGSIRLPQKPMISPLFSGLTNGNFVRMPANDLTLPPELT